MSIEARRWAHLQRCGTSSRQFVLHLLAEWADPWGYVRHVNVDYIAEKTVQSRANVFRHFAVFEEARILTRFLARDDDGERTCSGQLDLTASLRLPSHTKRKVEEAAGDSRATPSSGESQDATHSFEMGVASCDSRESQDATPSLYLESESNESSPPTPPRGEFEEKAIEEEEGSQQAEIGEESLGAAFLALVQAYPVHAAMNLEAARRELGRIARGEWPDVIAAARRVAEAMAKHRRLHPKDLATWLRQRGDKLIAQIKADAPAERRQRVFVIEGTRAWEAHMRVRAAAGLGRPPNYTYRGDDGTKPHLRGKTGWFFASLFPPQSGEASREPEGVDF